MHFRLLGGVRVTDGAGREVPVGPAKRQLVLAALLADAGRLVTADCLVDRGWGAAPPPQVAGVLRAHLSRIRAQLILVRGDGSRPGLVRRSGGYLLDVDPGQVDVHRSRALAVAADAAADDEQRAALLGLAREVSAGDPLAGLSGAWAEETAAALRREQGNLTVAWATVQLRLGRVAAVVEALGEAVERDRFDEVLAAAFLEALAASGRRARALAEYGRIRAHLLAELGTEPGPELRAVHRALLEPDAAPAVRGPGAGRAPVAQLPPAVRPFHGRDADLAALDAARTGPARTVVVTGPGGVGKTALVVQWAWQRREHFPDGQVHLDLRGLDAEAVPPGRVLEHLLRVLGVPAADVPADLDERAALYRSRMAGRRMLVLLDNAGSSAQVRPLLPGSPSCFAVVTSRWRLDGLVAQDGADRSTVEVLDEAASVALLASMLSGARTGPAPDADSLHRLARLCGGLPLALRIAAARVLADPARSVPALVSELAGTHRLAGLVVEDGDVAVRGAFALSYRALPADQARAFALLGLAPATGEGLGVPAAAALIGADDATTRRVLGALADAHLVVPRPDGRYDMHDLLRLYAREQAASADDSSADDALRRLLLWYARRSDAADRPLSRGRPVLPRPAATRGDPGSFADEAAALAWFRAEAAMLRALTLLAAERRWDDLTWPLAESQAEVLRREHRVDDLLAVSDLGATAAHRAGNRTAEALLTNTGGIARLLAGDFDDAVDRQRRAAELHLRDGNLARAGLTRMNVGSSRSDQGRYDEARQEYQAALELLERAGHPAGLALCFCNLGELLRRCGEYADAERYLRRAIDAGAGLGTQRDLAIARENLAEVLAAVDRPDEAFDEYAAALVAARAAGDRLTEGRALLGRGDLLARLGRTAQAGLEWQEALTVLADIGAPEAVAVHDRLTSPPAPRPAAAGRRPGR